MSDRSSDLLSPEYRVERELGGGGMSRVFVAEETALGRKVVVKVLPPELTAVVSEDRFRREIQVAGGLQHPNIVPLYTAGAWKGVLFLTMPFVEGESLRARLLREGELPLRDAVRIGRDMIDALAYAHARGIVHRDIKPENILLSGRHALVTDFGVAKALAQATGGDAALTSTGLAIGTPAYMAPEQAAADPHADHRADLYAAGLVMYEMLTGQRPFDDLPPAAVLAAHATRPVTPPAELRPAVPAGLNALVMRCLEKRPADRPQSAEELLRDLEGQELGPSGETTPTRVSAIFPGRSRLRRFALLGGVAAVAAAAVLIATQRGGTVSESSVPSDSVRLIAVANFQHGPGDADLARGVSAALRSRLQDVPGLFVPNNDAMRELVVRFLGISDPTTFTADSLFQFITRTGGHGMLVGSVERLGSGFVLTVQLLPTVRRPDPPISLSLTESAVDSTQLVAALDRLTAGLREQLGEVLPRLRAPEVRGGPWTAKSLEALRLYDEALRGPWSAEDYGTAVAKLRQAVLLDSSFAEAHRRLATGLNNLGIRRAEQIRAVEAAWRERDHLRPWERGLVEGSYHAYRGEFQASIAAYQKLVSEAPNFPIPLNNLAVQYTRSGQHDLAELLYRRVADTTFKNWFYASNWLHSLMNLGRLKEVDSLLALARKAGADTGSEYDGVRRSRLVVDRRYIELGQLTDPDAVSAAQTSTLRLRQFGSGQYASLVLGSVSRFEDLASQRSTVYRELGDGRGVLLQGLGIATARLRVLGDAAGARRALEEAFTAQPFDGLELLDRPYPELASLLADLGSIAESERLIQRWEREVPREYSGLDRQGIELARGDLALARNQPAMAIEHYRHGDRSECIPCNLPRFARAWDRIGRPDSAIAAYERYLTLPATDRAQTDAFELARAYLRLGELYESTGKIARAIERYGNVLELWENADPALESLVRAVRERLARLRQVIG